MVKTGSEYSPIKEADVDKLLAQYDVKRIIIGHTENSRVKYTYNKKVYDICVNHPKAFEKETRAVVIEGDDIKAINDEGELVTIKNKLQERKEYEHSFLRLFLSTLVLVLISSGIQAGTYHSGDKKKKNYLVTDLIYSIRQTVVRGLLMSIRKDGLQTRLMRHYLKISVSV